MKIKHLLTTVGLLIFITASAQKCKPAKKVDDKLTGETALLWGGKLGAFPAAITGYGYKVNLYVSDHETKADSCYLIFTAEYKVPYSQVTHFDVSFEEGVTIFLRTSAGIMESTSIKTYRFDWREGDYYKIVNQVNGLISKEQAEILSKNVLEFYRVPDASGKYIEGKVNKGNASKFIQQLNCYMR